MNLIFRMSQSGLCPRRLSAMILKPKEALIPPPWLAKAAEEGNLHEQLMKLELRRLGCDVRYEQEELREDFEGCSLVGHIDGQVRLSDKVLGSDRFDVILMGKPDLSVYYPLEVKSFGFNEWQRWRAGGFGAFGSYASQLSCYMHAMGALGAVYATKDRSGGARQLFFLPSPPVAFEEVKERIGLVADYVGRGELVPGEYNAGELECRRCEFRIMDKPDAVVVEDRDMAQVLEDYVEARDMETQAHDEKERFRELILVYGKEAFKAGDCVAKVRWQDRESVSLREVLKVVKREIIENAITKSHFQVVSVTKLNEVGKNV